MAVMRLCWRRYQGIDLLDLNVHHNCKGREKLFHTQNMYVITIVNNSSLLLPAHVSLQVHALAPSSLPPPSHEQEELPLSYQSYYSIPTHEDLSRVYADPHQSTVPGSSAVVEANLPVSRHSFAGAVPTYH